MSRPAWTLTEAVERTGASRSTIRRYREAGKFPNAYKDTAGTWRFPLEDLLAVGLSPSEPARGAQGKLSEQPLSTATAQVSAAAAEQVSKLEHALILERTRAENAERLAASYLANVEDLRRALLMLEAGTGKPEQSSEPAQSTSADHAHLVPTEKGQQDVSRPAQPSRWSPFRRLIGR